MAHTAPTDIFTDFLADLEALPSSSRLDWADTEAIYTLAYQLVAQGHFDTSYRYFSLLTLFRPTEVKYLAGLALSYKMLQRYDAAVGVYSFMAVIEPAEPLHHLSIAECLLLGGDTEQARDTLALVMRFCQENNGHEKAAERAKAIALLLSARTDDAA